MEDISLTRPGTAVLGVDATPPSRTSAVSWPAILAGAVAAAATSVLLVVLATGAGLAAVSPWPGSGASAKSAALMAAIAFIVIQWLSAGVGGYLTGRLRTRWVNTHAHEVFFRDTAHGFITWAVATLIVASTAVSSGYSLLGAGAHAVGTTAAAAAPAAAKDTIDGYELDMLFRATPAPDSKVPSDTDARRQAGRILAKGVVAGSLPDADRTYVTQLIAAQTGISVADAQHRVDEITAQLKADADKAREAADAARKAGETAAILAALAMLIGAFIASVSAALGGRLRDEQM
jgi:hypothetical protein